MHRNAKCPFICTRGGHCRPRKRALVSDLSLILHPLDNDASTSGWPSLFGPLTLQLQHRAGTQEILILFLALPLNFRPTTGKSVFPSKSMGMIKMTSFVKCFEIYNHQGCKRYFSAILLAERDHPSQKRN